MSDMAPQFYNAWKVVMGEVPHRLFCAWHVDKSFRDNCRRLLANNSEKCIQVYKTVRTLMDEQDVNTFETMLPAVLSHLHLHSSSEQTTQHVRRAGPTVTEPTVASIPTCIWKGCTACSNMFINEERRTSAWIVLLQLSLPLCTTKNLTG